jgi:hypothetical protein
MQEAFMAHLAHRLFALVVVALGLGVAAYTLMAIYAGGRYWAHMRFVVGMPGGLMGLLAGFLLTTAGVLMFVNARGFTRQDALEQP